MKTERDRERESEGVPLARGPRVQQRVVATPNARGRRNMSGVVRDNSRDAHQPRGGIPLSPPNPPPPATRLPPFPFRSPSVSRHSMSRLADAWDRERERERESGRSTMSRVPSRGSLDTYREAAERERERERPSSQGGRGGRSEERGGEGGAEVDMDGGSTRPLSGRTKMRHKVGVFV
ncbi:hypothetical protein KIPB_014069 [Kipferlia bialata]|uniref:Uncharacterized protein n=1 Tax=Kipferlia bialata TaxID=797122 RepID=A0A391NSZ9_9EUKA|nr:hypothetical protein KIPB_014069 [Kipferlia bialata]|eukprot:g14069.t1